MENEKMENRDNHNARDEDDNVDNFATEAKGSKAKADDLTREEKNDNARVGDFATEAEDNKARTEESRSKSEAATREDTIEITTKKTTMAPEQRGEFPFTLGREEILRNEIKMIVGKLHHQIRLRILSCSRVSENHRGPEVPEVKVRAVECRDGLARITSEELAITHSVKDGILQNACTTRPRVVAVLVKSAHSHIVRLTHSRRNGPNRIMTKAPWLYWKRVIGMNENLLPTDITIDQGNLIRVVVKRWDEIHRNVNYLIHDNWVAYFRTWRRRSLFSGRAPTCRDQSNVWSSPKAIARHTKIRDQNPSLGYICPGEPHERSPNASKFEDLSQEETEWQEQGAREAAWKLANSVKTTP